MRAWDFIRQVIEAEDWTAYHHLTWRNGESYGIVEHPNTNAEGNSTFGLPSRWWFFSGTCWVPRYERVSRRRNDGAATTMVAASALPLARFLTAVRTRPRLVAGLPLP
jgi:hypothetical protein